MHNVAILSVIVHVFIIITDYCVYVTHITQSLVNISGVKSVNNPCIIVLY